MHTRETFLPPGHGHDTLHLSCALHLFLFVCVTCSMFTLAAVTNNVFFLWGINEVLLTYLLYDKISSHDLTNSCLFFFLFCFLFFCFINVVFIILFIYLLFSQTNWTLFCFREIINQEIIKVRRRNSNSQMLLLIMAVLYQ